MLKLHTKVHGSNACVNTSIVIYFHLFYSKLSIILKFNICIEVKVHTFSIMSRGNLFTNHFILIKNQTKVVKVIKSVNIVGRNLEKLERKKHLEIRDTILGWMLKEARLTTYTKQRRYSFIQFYTLSIRCIVPYQMYI